MTKQKKKRNFYMGAHALVAGFCRFLFRVKARGIENIPESGCVLCINHTQFQDPIVIGAAVPRQVRFLAKRELLRVPVIGWLIRALGAVPIERGAGDVGAVKKVIALTKEGEITAVFPQGHRYKGVHPLSTPRRSGIGMIACRTGLPVVPVCIELYKQRYSIFHPTEVIIGKPLLYTDFVADGEGGKANYEKATDGFFLATCALGGYLPEDLVEMKGDDVCK